MNPSAMSRFSAPAMVQSLLTRERLDIRSESPDQPQVRALLGSLDDYLAGLYEPQHNYILSVDELLLPQVQAVGLYERVGYRCRAAFGGPPDDGMPLFYEKRLGR